MKVSEKAATTLRVPIAFTYRTQHGHPLDVQLLAWREAGHYLSGICAADGRWKTYRIDRVQAYLGGAEALLIAPFQDPPPTLPKGKRDRTDQPRVHASGCLQVCFTGFAAADKRALSDWATEAGLNVVGSVTRGLHFLVCGDNAGWKKLQLAREQGCYVFNRLRFLQFLETGELPDHPDDGVGEPMEQPSEEMAK